MPRISFRQWSPLPLALLCTGLSDQAAFFHEGDLFDRRAQASLVSRAELEPLIAGGGFELLRYAGQGEQGLVWFGRTAGREVVALKFCCRREWCLRQVRGRYVADNLNECGELERECEMAQVARSKAGALVVGCFPSHSASPPAAYRIFEAVSPRFVKVSFEHSRFLAADAEADHGLLRQVLRAIFHLLSPSPAGTILVHTDLTEENLFWDADAAEVRIFDFSLAEQLSTITPRQAKMVYYDITKELISLAMQSDFLRAGLGEDGACHRRLDEMNFEDEGGSGFEGEGQRWAKYFPPQDTSMFVQQAIGHSCMETVSTWTRNLLEWRTVGENELASKLAGDRRSVHVGDLSHLFDAFLPALA